MKIKHPGYALTEMLVIIATLVVLTTLTVRPLRMMISEIPHSARICQTLNSTTNALNQLKNDIEQAAHITGFKNGILTLEHPGGPVVYTLADGRITRRPGIQPQDAEYTWQLPNVRIETALWTQNSTPYAVELTSWNQQQVLGNEQIRFKQSTVFFQKGTHP